MRLTDTLVAGAFLIEPEPRTDERGFFARSWCRDDLAAAGLNGTFIQCNNSYSAHRGTLRGLHYQVAPFTEAKLMRCVAGAIFDVVLDVRTGSPTFGRWTGAILSAENRLQMYVPEGCAHGFLTLADHSEVIYPVTAAYNPKAERGIRWNDPAFDVQWPPVEALTISSKDRSWPDFDRTGLP